MASGEANSVLDLPQGVRWFGGIRAVWSLDGEAIIYSTYNEAASAGRLMWRDLASGVDRELYRDPGLAPMLLHLAPDGRNLLFAIRDPLGGNPSVIYSGGRLMIMDLETGAVRELHAIHEHGQVESLQWTPDGKYALFSQREPDGYHVWRVAEADGRAEKLWKYGLGPFRLSPDGRQTAHCEFTGATEVWVMENLKAALEH